MRLFKGKSNPKSRFKVHTRDIYLKDLREVFFPKTFDEKYSYLGSVPYNVEGDIFKALEPLIIFMDYKARPKFCPRWFLRFLHLFGNDKSVVRVRNWKLHNLFQKLTKGILIVDYKTKWTHYDLRVSLLGDESINNLERIITNDFYRRGYKEEIISAIKKYDPEFKKDYQHIDELVKYLNELGDDGED
jgi:hypothetical protein